MKSNVLVGVLAGIATGAILGVLFAPDKGSKTRKKIKSKSLEAKENLKEEFDAFLESASDKYTSLIDNGKDLLGKEKEIIKDAVNSKN